MLCNPVFLSFDNLRLGGRHGVVLAMAVCEACLPGKGTIKAIIDSTLPETVVRDDMQYPIYPGRG